MRTVLTGAGNPVGHAILEALLAAGHGVRAFGGNASDVAGTEAQWHPGHLATPGSIEPVLAEREVLVHAAPCDAPAHDKNAHGNAIERGTLGACYGAERELMELFVHVIPADAGKFASAQVAAAQHVAALRKVPAVTVSASSPEAAAKTVLEAIAAIDYQGRYPGRETDAVAA